MEIIIKTRTAKIITIFFLPSLSKKDFIWSKTSFTINQPLFSQLSDYIILYKT